MKKPTSKEYMKKYREENRDKILETKRKSYQKHKDDPEFKVAARNRWYLKKYGITLEEYNAKFEEQGGKCAACGTHQLEFRRRLVVDHNHNTGAVRGLLCDACNTAIGFVKESTGTLYSLIDYLNKHSAVE